MHYHRWTLALLGLGFVSLPSLGRADEKPSPVLTALSATTISGYVDTSAQWNVGTGDANVPNYVFGGPGKADGFNLNVVKLSIEKPIVPEDVWAAGYKVDLLFGPDANAFASQSTGITADFAVKQAYVALHAPVGNGLDFKLGVWDSIMGYEVFESINNPNVTRSYGWTMEPVSHTGLQATYQLTEALSATAAIADTFGTTINGRPFLGGGTTVPPSGEGPKAESYKAYMVSMTFTAPTNWGVLSGSTLSGSVMNGFNATSPARGYTPADQTSWYIGGTINTPLTGLKLGVAYDYAGVSEQPLTGHKSGYANAIGLYGLYQLTEKLSLNGRAEYVSASLPATFLARKVFEVTGTLQYDLWKNVLTRLELRWDHAADGSTPYGGTIVGAGTEHNSVILLADVAYKF